MKRCIYTTDESGEPWNDRQFVHRCKVLGMINNAINLHEIVCK